MRAYESAVEAGAQEVVVVDTLGIATPEAAAFLVGEVVERLDGEVPVHWHGHDDFGLATAAAVAAVQAGATWVQGTVNGMGERAGNADLVEVALALEALYGIPTRLRLEQARALGASSQRARGHAARALEGRARARTSSRASRARSRRSSTTRRRSSRTRRSSSAPSAGIVLGKKSGLDSIRIKVEELGLDVPEERFPELLEAVKRAGAKKRGLVTDAEFGGSRAGTRQGSGLPEVRQRAILARMVVTAPGDRGSGVA